jgi:elongation factor Ts
MEVTVNPKDVMALRQKTGLGMMDCKRALEHTSGDMNAAEEWLRAQRRGKMETRTERVTGEGRIAIRAEGDKAVIVEVRTETDFTARNEGFVKMMDDVAAEALNMPAGDIMPNDFIAKRIDDLRITTGENVNFARGIKVEGGTLGNYVHHDAKRAALVQVSGNVDAETLKGICQHIVFHDPAGVSEADIPTATLQRVREESIVEAKETGKPEQIAQKIAEGKVRKFLEEKVLLHQKYILDETKTVAEVLPAGATIQRFVRYTLGA